MKTAEPRLAAGGRGLTMAADAQDRAEDAEHRADLRGDETPDGMAGSPAAGAVASGQSGRRAGQA